MRTTRQARWLKYPDLEWLSQDDIQSDALLDLRTEDNKLSVYKVENEADTERVIIALAATRENLSNLDYAVFEDSTLASTDITISQQNGETPDAEVNKLHYDLANLTVRKLVLLAQAVSSGEHARMPVKEIKARLQRAIRAGTLNQGRLKPQLLEKIQ